MTATRLEMLVVEKPWGRRDLLPIFSAQQRDELVGEIWFLDPEGRDQDLLVKYLFTSEKLSLQVHPGNDAAEAAGYARGKDEAWVIVAAEPGSKIGIGLREPASIEVVRSAALDGRLDEMIDWKPTSAGDVWYCPAGTIHALGAGLSLIEIQQNLDLTYRLYDYGRPRELQLEEALAVAHLGPYFPPYGSRTESNGREIIFDSPSFVLERWTGSVNGQLSGRQSLWITVVSGGGKIDGDDLAAGTVWLVEGGAELVVDPGSVMLVAYTGGIEANLLATT